MARKKLEVGPKMEQHDKPAPNPACPKCKELAHVAAPRFCASCGHSFAKVEQPVEKKSDGKLEVPLLPRYKWVRFRAKGRCFVDGVLIEAADQEITMSPRAAYLARHNKNLELIEGSIPPPPDNAPKLSEASGRKERIAYKEYEQRFMDALEDGDPKVTAAPKEFNLVKQ